MSQEENIIQLKNNDNVKLFPKIALDSIDDGGISKEKLDPEVLSSKADKGIMIDIVDTGNTSAGIPYWKALQDISNSDIRDAFNKGVPVNFVIREGGSNEGDDLIPVYYVRLDNYTGKIWLNAESGKYIIYNHPITALDTRKKGYVTGTFWYVSKKSDGYISTSNIYNNVITTDKLGNEAVTENKLANGAITTNKIKDKTVTRDKLVEGNNIPIILTLTQVEDDFYKVNKNDVEKDATYFYVEGITDDNISTYVSAYVEGTPIFLNMTSTEEYRFNCLIPVTSLFGNSDSPIATLLMHSFTLSFYGFVFIKGKALVYTIEDDTYFDRNFLKDSDINGLEYTSISFKSSGITTVTVPPNRRMYYYDQNAESDDRYPKYSMGAHGNVTFNLDLPEDSDTVSYHIELYEYLTDKKIKFPENINFQITPISTFGYTSESDDSVIQPNVEIDRTGTKITVEDTSNGGNSNNRNYHMIIDIFFNGKYYLGTIRVIPMIEGSQMPKNSKIKFVFDNDGGSYSDIVPSSGTIGDNGLLYTNKAGEFTYTYKGTKYTPGITINSSTPINRVIHINN